MIEGAEEVLRSAREILEGTHHVPRTVVVIAAAFLARQALERVVTVLSGAGDATMRSKLVVTRVLHGDEAGDLAWLAWDGLNRACHQHAYRVTPGADEVGRCAEAVAALLAFCAEPARG